MSIVLFDNFAFGSAVGFLFALAWEVVTCRLFKLGRFSKPKGLHLHHSLMGPGAWLVLPRFFDFGAILTFGIGSGVVLQHWVMEGFAFISKE